MAIYFLKLFDDVGRSISVKNSDTIFLGYAADLVRHSAGNGNNSLLSLKEKRLPPLRQGDSVWRNLDIWGRLWGRLRTPNILGEVVGWIYAAGRNLSEIPNRNLVNLLVRPTDAVEGITELVPFLGGLFVLDGLSDRNLGFGAVGGNRTLVRGRLPARHNTADALHRTADDCPTDGAIEDLGPILRREKVDVVVHDGRRRLVDSLLRTLSKALRSRALRNAKTKPLGNGLHHSILCSLSSNGLDGGTHASPLKGRIDAASNKRGPELWLARFLQKGLIALAKCQTKPGKDAASSCADGGSDAGEEGSSNCASCRARANSGPRGNHARSGLSKVSGSGPRSGDATIIFVLSGVLLLKLPCGVHRLLALALGVALRPQEVGHALWRIVGDALGHGPRDHVRERASHLTKLLLGRVHEETADAPLGLRLYGL